MDSSNQNSDSTKDSQDNKITEEKEEQFHKDKYKKKGDCPNFLLKLYNILENDEYKNTISWSEDGNNFVIHNMHSFSQNILPQYFKHNNYSSFIRQLNMYNFHKQKSGQNEHIFHNKNFVRNRKDLIKEIKRKNKNEKIMNSNNALFNAKKNDFCPFPNFNLFNNLNNSNSDVNNRKSSLSLEDDLNLSNSMHSLFEPINRPCLPMHIPSSSNNNKLNVNNELYYLNNDNYLKKDKYNNSIDINKNNINMNVLDEGNKKITKKDLETLLTLLGNSIEENSVKQKQLEQKIERLSKQNEDFITKNQNILNEIITKTDYNKKLEAVISFILEMILAKSKMKNNSEIKNLLSNDFNTNKLYNGTNNFDNLNIINFTSSNDQKNSIKWKNDYSQQNRDILEPFQNYFNKFMEKTKNYKLLSNEDNTLNTQCYTKNNYTSNSLISKKRMPNDNLVSILNELDKETINNNSFDKKETKENMIQNDVIKTNECINNNIDNNNINNESFSSWNKSKNIFDIDITQEENKFDEKSDISDWNKDLLNNSQSSISDFYINKDKDIIIDIDN
jgi:hypothetical protein